VNSFLGLNSCSAEKRGIFAKAFSQLCVSRLVPRVFVQVTAERENSWDALVELPIVELARNGEILAAGARLSASEEVRMTKEETTALITDGIKTLRP